MRGDQGAAELAECGRHPAGRRRRQPAQAERRGRRAKQSNDQTQKREELTNYEVSSKSIQTTSAGFLIQNLSIAVLINRAALTASLGDKASPEAIAAQVKEIEQLVASAAGFERSEATSSRSRWSISSIRAAISNRRPGPRWSRSSRARPGSIVNAAAIVLVAAMVDLVRRAARLEDAARRAPGRERAASRADGDARAPDVPKRRERLLIETDAGRDEFLEALLARRDNGPERKLLKLVEFDENQAATILKQWIRQGANG